MTRDMLIIIRDFVAAIGLVLCVLAALLYTSTL